MGLLLRSQPLVAGHQQCRFPRVECTCQAALALPCPCRTVRNDHAGRQQHDGQQGGLRACAVLQQLCGRQGRQSMVRYWWCSRSRVQGTTHRTKFSATCWPLCLQTIFFHHPHAPAPPIPTISSPPFPPIPAPLTSQARRHNVSPPPPPPLGLAVGVAVWPHVVLIQLAGGGVLAKRQISLVHLGSNLQRFWESTGNSRSWAGEQLHRPSSGVPC